MNSLYRYLFLLLFSLLLQAKEPTVLCFSSETNSSFCKQLQKSSTVLLDHSHIKDSLFLIQNSIREKIDKEKSENLILMAEKFDGTLLTIAQENMLPYYRKKIHLILLKESYGNLYKRCHESITEEDNKTCQLIKEFTISLEKRASLDEVYRALSPVLQMDWYGTKMIIVGLENPERQIWKEAFKYNKIEHKFISNKLPLKIKKWFPIPINCKIPIPTDEKKPNYYPPLLRFHLWKILYQSKNLLTWENNCSYGEDEAQKYDVVYREESQKNPLLIYIHGGGWSSGDKSNFHAFCEQYADRNFTAISANYRLLKLPLIGFKEMVSDVNLSIIKSIENAKKYHANPKNITIMADSAGAMLAYIAITQLPPEYKINRVVFNSIPSDFNLFSEEKQQRLSGLEDKKALEAWIKKFSPLNNLFKYSPKTLLIASLNDTIVTSKHTEQLEIQSVINFDNIHSIWVENAFHPTVPIWHTIQPSYLEISFKIDNFIQ